MDITDKLKIIANHHQTLTLRYHELGTHIARLTAAGCIDAKEYWKDGKYLYLLYSMKGGVRRKTYVGNHPLRIEEARQKLDNYKKRLSLIETQRKISAELRDIEYVVTELLGICSTSDLSARFAMIEEMGTGSRRRLSENVPN